MAKIAAQNIAADVTGAPSHSLSINELGAICMLDAGNGGMAIKTDRVFGGGKTHVTSGPHARWGQSRLREGLPARTRARLRRLLARP